MPYGRPESDLAVGDWTSTPLYPNLDEQAADDGDFISSGDEPEYDFFTVKLNTLPRPVRGEHVLRIRLRQDGVTPIPTGVELLQWDESLQEQRAIAVWMITPETHFNTVELFLSEDKIRQITDYTNLRVRITAGMWPVLTTCCEEEIPAMLKLTLSIEGSTTLPCECADGEIFILTRNPQTDQWESEMKSVCGRFWQFWLFCDEGVWNLRAFCNHFHCGGNWVASPGSSCDPLHLEFGIDMGDPVLLSGCTPGVHLTGFLTPMET